MESIDGKDEKRMNEHPDNILDFLYWNAPFGFPSDDIVIGTEFEAGCHEDWGFVVYRIHWIEKDVYRLERIASGRLEKCLTEAREQLSKPKTQEET
jgi:hypothetical protein